MVVYLDVKPKLDVAAAQLAMREATALIRRTGDEISHGFGTSLSKAFGAVDTSVARREMQALQAAAIRTADVEADAARRMVSSARQIEVAQFRVKEAYEKSGAESAAYAAKTAALMDG